MKCLVLLLEARDIAEGKKNAPMQMQAKIVGKR